MKIRVLPYGYTYNNGSLIVNEEEAKNLIEIFEMYSKGMSLLQIAQILNVRRIEYRAGSMNWNKARIMRILSDSRYLGNSEYPAIISEDIFNRCNEIKNSRNKQSGTDRTETIYKIKVPILCPLCKSSMQRRGNSSAGTSKWYCRAPGCSTVVRKDDKVFLYEIQRLLNQLIDEPSRIYSDKSDEDFLEKAELIRVKMADIIAAYDGTNGAETERKITSYISEQFSQIPDALIRTERIKDIFREAEKTDDFPMRLFQRVVREILFSEDDSIAITLKNGQTIQGP